MPDSAFPPDLPPAPIPSALWRDDFDAFEGRAWINCAHQGALPAAAAEAARKAIEWKRAPHRLTTGRFEGVPRRLRAALARLLNAPETEISIANSASYGLHLLANGMPLQAGDEVLLMEGDFPSNVLPWLAHQRHGVAVRQLRPHQAVLEADEVAEALTPSTRVVCLSWVHSFSGWVLDIERIAEACRANGTWLLVNASQGLGARPLDVRAFGADAVISVGHKWLCGPYATGLLWMRPELRAALQVNRCYWLSLQTADDLANPDRPLVPDIDLASRRFDQFGTANFFNFTAWTAAVEYLLACGTEAVRDHSQGLVQRLIDGLDDDRLADRYELFSPRSGPRRSALVFLGHRSLNGRQPETNSRIYQRLQEAGVDVALRNGRLRVSPHVFNEARDIDRLLDVLATSA